jgi:hypothetical protein
LKNNLTTVEAERNRLQSQILTQQAEHDQTKTNLFEARQQVQIAEKFGLTD